MKHIGPFLKVNALNSNNICNQLFYFSKESLKQIVLNSKCGIVIKASTLKKNISINDINIIDSISPLMCIYKRGDSKITLKNNNIVFKSNSLKKEINIKTNAYMTLSILELAEFYKNSTNLDLNDYSKLLMSVAKQQLDFFASSLRDSDGFFIDKKDVSDSILSESKFEVASKDSGFLDQILMMHAFYKFYTLTDDIYKDTYRDFAIDILNMVLEYHTELCKLSPTDYSVALLHLCIMYKISGIEEIHPLLLELENFIASNCSNSKTSFTTELLIYINNIFMKENLSSEEFCEKDSLIKQNLVDLFDHGDNIIDTPNSKFYSRDIILYILNLSLRDLDENDIILPKVFKTYFSDGGLIPSFFDVPDNKNIERYKNYSLEPNDLIDESNFSNPDYPKYSVNQVAPVYLKKIYYNQKKNKFKRPKDTFDSYTNMFVNFLVLHFIKPKY